jgi:hypothetical protein
MSVSTPRFALPLVSALVLSAACSAEPGSADGFGFGDEEDTEGAADDAVDTAADGADGADGGGDDDGAGAAPVPDVPHALGVVVLGETHPAGGGQPTPIVSAAFLPDSTMTADRCAADIGGCSVATSPDCGTACTLDEVCTFSAQCVPTCEAICDMACDEGQECYFPVPGSPSCRERERFDAGALTFSGTTVPVSLFPPYEFVGDVTGALAVPGQEISVNGSGATEAGFATFSRTFTGTAPLVSEVADITMEEAYGAGPLHVRWEAGEDAVRVSLTVSGVAGSYGVVTCDAEDSGLFEVPRAAISAAVDGDEPSAIFIDVTRHNTTVHKDLSTVGTLLQATVQSEAWVELVSSSSESAAIAGCSGSAFCGGACVDTLYDESNCGSCNTVCGPAQTCSVGECVDGAGTGGGGGGACCVTSASPGCSDAAVQACVCASDSFCCSSSWDSACVDEVVSLGCGVC